MVKLLLEWLEPLRIQSLREATDAEVAMVILEDSLAALQSRAALEAEAKAAAAAKEAARPEAVVKVDGTPAKRAGLNPHAYPARPSPPRSATSPIPRAGSCWAGTGFRQLLLRGVEKVTCGWALICTAHNLAKLTRRR